MTLRAWSKSLKRPSVEDDAEGSSLPIDAAPDGGPAVRFAACQSVHAAGMSERLPSGRHASNNITPRRRMLPITARSRPSNAWPWRVMTTASGISR